MTPTQNRTSSLPAQARIQMVRNIEKFVRTKFVNLAAVDVDAWARDMHDQTNRVLDGPLEAFEDVVRRVLAGLKSSHTGFFHGVQNRFLPQHTINATLVRCDAAGGLWVFNDVFPEGPADRAGICSGDVLLTINGVPPPLDSPPQFQMGQTHWLSIKDAKDRSEER